MKKMLEIYCDFDGTITLCDTMNKILEKHADPIWLEYDENFLSGKLPSSECITKQISLLRGKSHEKILETIESSQIDNTFIDFAKQCEKNQIPLLIVSDGLDFYISKILSKNNICLPVKSNKYTGNGKVEFPYKPLCNKNCANCKVSHFSKNTTKIYIGDGQSDYCAARKCEIIFAKKRLADLLRRDKIEFYLFDKFSDITNKLKDLNYLTS